jgi:hypothetical protein
MEERKRVMRKEELEVEKDKIRGVYRWDEEM